MERKLTVAIEGCCHGQLTDIYQHLERYKQKIDLLIICGDFQAIRNITDLETMSCPNKYKQIGGFYRYYSGELRAPIPTLFVGGNHEANNHMRELYYGGWVAPNIYYMGASGVVRFGGLRIGGITGIYKNQDYAKGHFELPPFRGSDRPAMHHVRSYEAFKMLQIRRPLDIVVSHDWPQYIERYGDTRGLLAKKPFFKDEVNRGDLGSPVNSMLLERLRPSWWVSAHMHVKFEAQLEAHDSIFPEGWAGIPPYNAPSNAKEAKNEDEIVMDSILDDNSETNEPPNPSSDTNASDPKVPDRPTRFLALDKCLPRRQFLKVIELETTDDDQDIEEEPKLEYDPEWLAILRLCHSYMPLTEESFYPPIQTTGTMESLKLPLFSNQVLDQEINWVSQNVFKNGSRLVVPSNFMAMAPVPPPGTPDSANFGLVNNNGNQSGMWNRGGRGESGRGRGRDRGGGHNSNVNDGWEGPRPYSIYPNPQTQEFCQMLDIDDKLTQRLR